MQKTTDGPRWSRIEDVLETVKCPLCETEESKVVFASRYPSGLKPSDLIQIYRSSSDVELMDQLVECRKCSLRFLSPRIREEIIMESYSGAEDQVFIAQNPERIETFSQALRTVGKIAGLVPSKNVRVLDIGCAGGAFPKAAHDIGYAVVGIEPSRFLATKAAEAYKLDIRAGVLSDHKFPDASFDMVTLWDVLEHLTDPNGVLAEIRRILKPNGVLVVNYPDVASLACRLLGRKWPFYLSVHLIYFTPETVTKFLNKSGFAVVRTRPFWQTLKLGYILKRASAYFGVFKYIGKLVGAAGCADVPCKYNIGQTLVVARKSER